MSTVRSADGTVIDFDVYGDAGPVVIFVSGASQHRAIDARTARIATALADDGYVGIDYDRRGRGRSEDTQPWSMQREIEDLAALVDLAGGRAILSTSSSGAAIALAAVADRVLIDGLLCYEPPFLSGQNHENHLSRMRALVAAGRNEDTLRYNLTEVIRFKPASVDTMAREKWWWSAMISIAPTLVYDLAAVHEVNVDPDWAARWSGATMPTLVCSGDSSYPGMSAAADAVAAALPNARRRVMAGQGHGPKAEALTRVLTEFLAELHPAGPASAAAERSGRAV